MKIIEAKINTITPFHTGNDENCGNIKMTRMIEYPGEQNDQIKVDKTKLLDWIEIISGMYKSCDWSGFIKKRWADYWKDRIFLAGYSSDIMEFVKSLQQNSPIESIINNQVMDFILSLKKKDSDSLLQWSRSYPDLLAFLSSSKESHDSFMDSCDDDEIIFSCTKKKFVPIIPGNQIRGIMRDITMGYVIQKLFNESPNKVLNKNNYDILFSGGRLDSSTGTVEIESKRQLREALPFLSIFGCMLGNDNFPGKMKIGIARLDCQETGINKIPACNFLVKEFGTRTDDYEGQKEEKDKTIQMIYNFICIKPGSTFSWEVAGDCMNPIEQSWFNFSLELIKQYGHLGGLSRAGYGKVDIQYDEEIEYSNDHIGKFLEENKDSIIETINTLGK